jgi:hypothetical protein
MSIDTPRTYRRIATEEGWMTPELAAMYRRAIDDGSIPDPGFQSLWGFFAGSQSERAATLYRRIQDLDGERIRDMDALGIDLQLLMLTAPGVQCFDAATGTAVKAAADGSVAAVTKDTTGTPIVVIRHADGLLTVYAGVDGLKVAKGDTVKKGQTIASVRNANPAFVHFEVRKGVDSLDPLPYVQ